MVACRFQDRRGRCLVQESRRLSDGSRVRRCHLKSCAMSSLAFGLEASSDAAAPARLQKAPLADFGRRGVSEGERRPFRLGTERRAARAAVTSLSTASRANISAGKRPRFWRRKWKPKCLPRDRCRSDTGGETRGRLTNPPRNSARCHRNPKQSKQPGERVQKRALIVGGGGA